MVRIEGVTLPDNKRVEIGLTYIFGIGLTRSQKILEKTGVNPDTRVKNLTEAEVNKIREQIEGKIMVEGDLKREIAQNIRRLKEIGSYRGQRHSAGLPSRGQRTKTNARTKKGKRNTVANKKKATK